MSIQVCISGVILGVLLGVLLCFSVLQGRQRREARKDDIERLIEHFQVLFRQIEQEKKQRP